MDQPNNAEAKKKQAIPFLIIFLGLFAWKFPGLLKELTGFSRSGFPWVTGFAILLAVVCIIWYLVITRLTLILPQSSASLNNILVFSLALLPLVVFILIERMASEALVRQLAGAAVEIPIITMPLGVLIGIFWDWQFRKKESG